MLLAGRIDGLPAEGLPLDDRGLAYGDGLFETVRIVAGRMPLLDRHLSRLKQGAVRLRLQFDESILRAEVATLVAEESTRHTDQDGFTLKIMLTRGSAGRGYRPQPGATARRIMLLFPAAAHPSSHSRDGIALYACSHRLSISPAFAGIKHLNRLEQVMARSEWDDEVHAEGVMFDMEGRLVEGTMSNLFVIRDSVLLTPSLSRCGINGVMRGWLLERAPLLYIRAMECDLSAEDLLAADEAFVCNSNIGIWPVRSFAGRQWIPGPLTRRLQEAVSGLWEA